MAIAYTRSERPLLLRVSALWRGVALLLIAAVFFVVPPLRSGPPLTALVAVLSNPMIWLPLVLSLAGVLALAGWPILA